ncbi:hypothetical protein F443_11590 [Phytophthora nicotianae P1569]|uniref:Uncharacterized protein n=3 Tax=Phytophthora nicotianae TaxID=4792 RepID=V9EW22_PHYNI|nr:hypothetical protein F443_11590 [Phytophthora nicotianae P1569]ETO72113.1 hypothetical protein F444_11663 [Phytophthora nicotianae P1976]
MSRRSREEAAYQKSFRRRLRREIRRYEWNRMVRMRYYITLDCLKDSEMESWVDRGTDKNFLTMTSL